MKILYLVLTALAPLFAACNSSGERQQAKTINTAHSSAGPVADSVQVKAEQALILTTGDYHAGEVLPDAAQRRWTGLFHNEAGYYLDTARLIIKKVFDPVLDEDEKGEHTGISVTVRHRDTAVLLVSGIHQLLQGKIKAIPEMSTDVYPFFVIAPDDSFRFDYAGAAYTLSVRARKVPVDGQPESFTLADYRLYISGLKNGRRIQQLLSAQPQLDDTEIGIMFCGDLDGDDVPDLMINTSNHYNVFQPTLYLSSKAGKNQLLQMVARHTSVGC